jgi:hypothetical protein
METDTLQSIPDFSTLPDQPIVISDDAGVQLVFRPKIPIVVGGRVVRLIKAVIFKRALACYFGLPNDETLRGHPLFSRGLEPYRSYVVRQSSWIRELSRRNSVHPAHSPASFDHLNHYVFTFKDEFFECVASGYELDTVDGNEESG